ncbi:hypothetical protein J3A83DRAFT_1417539 [Scleroderma citrinum]
MSQTGVNSFSLPFPFDVEGPAACSGVSDTDFSLLRSSGSDLISATTTLLMFSSSNLRVISGTATSGPIHTPAVSAFSNKASRMASVTTATRGAAKCFTNESFLLTSSSSSSSFLLTLLHGDPDALVFLCIPTQLHPFLDLQQGWHARARRPSAGTQRSDFPSPMHLEHGILVSEPLASADAAPLPIVGNTFCQVIRRMAGGFASSSSVLYCEDMVNVRSKVTDSVRRLFIVVMVITVTGRRVPRITLEPSYNWPFIDASTSHLLQLPVHELSGIGAGRFREKSIRSRGIFRSRESVVVCTCQFPISTAALSKIRLLYQAS